MAEIVEKEWLERDRYHSGKPIGFRQFKTQFGANLGIEEVILALDEPMDKRNQEKSLGNDNGVFFKETLEDVFLGSKDGCWRYVVSMGYIPSTSEIRKKCQNKK